MKTFRLGAELEVFPGVPWIKAVKVHFRNTLFIAAMGAALPLCAQQWIQKMPPHPLPAARYYHAVALNPQADTMIIFGGDSGVQPDLGDVWVLSHATDPSSPSSWLQLQPTGTSPGGRVFSSATYDQASNRLTIFGGGKGNSSPCENDVWVLTNANGTGGTPTWTQLSPTGTPPAPRGQHGAIYDPNSNRMTIFGGQNCFQTLFNDTWVLTNANGLGGTPAWSQVVTAGTPPSPREINGGVVYDPGSNRMMVVDGNANEPSSSVWILTNANGTGGTPTWMQLSPVGTSPPPRQNHSTVYDPATNRLTIFGGHDASNNPLSDVWILSNANGIGGTPTWMQIIPLGSSPSARSAHTAVYNPTNNRMSIFGGFLTNTPTTSTVVNDTLLLTDANGSLIQVQVVPLTATVLTNGTQQFTATVTGLVNTSVTWSLSGAGCSGTTCGTISSGGLYTAPAIAPSPSIVTVTATSLADSSKSGTATVLVATPPTAPAPPSGTTIPSGQSQNVSVNFSGGPGDAGITFDTITCAVTPAGGPSCSLSASSLTLDQNGNGSVQVTFTAGPRCTSLLVPPSEKPEVPLFAFLISSLAPALLFLRVGSSGRPACKRPTSGLAPLFLTVLVMLSTGACTGGQKTQNSSAAAAACTAPGTYTAKVTATSQQLGGFQASGVFTVTIVP